MFSYNPPMVSVCFLLVFFAINVLAAVTHSTSMSLAALWHAELEIAPWLHIPIMRCGFVLFLLIDIDLIPKIVLMFLGGSSGFVGSVFSQISKNVISTMCSDLSWFFEVSWCLKKYKGMLLGRNDAFNKKTNHRIDWFDVSPISKSESYKLKMKQHNSAELLSISFPQI